jgi:hypothetical protein
MIAENDKVVVRNHWTGTAPLEAEDRVSWNRHLEELRQGK